MNPFYDMALRALYVHRSNSTTVPTVIELGEREYAEFRRLALEAVAWDNGGLVPQPLQGEPVETEDRLLGLLVEQVSVPTHLVVR